MRRLLFAVLLALLIPSIAKAREMRLLRFPAVHDDTVVFTYASDLWVADRKGGPARRLTTHPGEETASKISPDGSLVAFLASYDGDPDVYVMPIAGGAPRRITYDSVGEYLVGWTPDGKVAYASSGGNFTTRQPRLWLADAGGGLPHETPLLEFGDGSFFPDGKRIAYTRSKSHTRNWRLYRGGNNGRIAIYDLAANTYAELTAGPENSWFPMVVGDSIFYASDRNLGAVNLYRRDLSTGNDFQLTHHAEADLRRPATDGKTIVYEHDGYIRAYDIAAGRDEKLTFEVRGDELGARPHLRKVDKSISNLSLSPSGKRVAVEARGEVFDVAVTGKDTRNVTGTPGVRESWPRWSPDGKTLAYLSDVSGETQIYAKPAGGGEAKQLSQHEGTSIAAFSWSPDGKRIAYWTREERFFLLDPETRKSKLIVRAENGGGLTFDWSPDGRWIAYNLPGKSNNAALYLYEVETGKSTRVTEGFYDDRNPTFDLSGKYLYFTSARTFNPTPGRFEMSLKVQDSDAVYVVPLTKDLPNPLFPKEEAAALEEAGEGEAGKEKKKEETARVKIDLEGFAERAIQVPLPAGGPEARLIGGREAVFHYEEGKLRKFDLASQEAIKILDGKEGYLVFNRDRSRFAYYEDGKLGVTEPKADVKPDTGKVDLAAVEVWVDPQAEWKQIFWEVWRFQRDNFFREDMAGLDWPAIGKRYEQYLPYVTDRRDLDYVLGLLFGELQTSHAYILNTPEVHPVPEDRTAKAALLGADYERDGRWLRFQRIYRGTLTQNGRRGPLGEPGLGIEKGHYLLEIDGHPVDADVHPSSLLINKADRVVTLTVNDRPTLEGARRVRVRPVASEGELRYYEWVEENRRKVNEMSGGRIGYLHYPNTSKDGQIEFIRGYYAQRDKEALIFDERFNAGGHPQPMVLPTLAMRWQTRSLYRRWGLSTEVLAINGPKVMLVNDYAGSGGDLTPWMFRDAGLGPLIGTRTLGALVGISASLDLMDGGEISAPSHTRFDPRTGEWIAENKGIVPDIEVDARPDLVAQGKDPQLDRAVQYLLEELEKNPVKLADPQLPPARTEQ